MKRSILFVMVVCMLVMAGASVAYASTVSSYAAWSATAGGNGTQPATPHKGYTTTTIKCAVCHAVHKAPAAGELLLSTTVADSCIFCHISQTSLGGNVALYNGVADNYTLDNAAAHGATLGCTGCHAVHGAATWGNGALVGGTVSQKILKSSAGLGHPQAAIMTGGIYGATYVATGLFTDREKAITAFCTQCHEYYQPVNNGEITVTYGESATYSSHVMRAVQTPYVSGLTGTYSGGAVANVDSITCRRCHDAGLTDESSNLVTSPRTKTANNFPHYTSGSARFLTGVGATEADAEKDGACIKCHVWNSGAAGVGVTF